MDKTAAEIINFIKTKYPTRKAWHDHLRSTLQKVLEQDKAPFNLWGRGHEERVVLSPRMAAIMRSLEIPRVHISGYGANYFYPKRVFLALEKRINRQFKGEVVKVYGGYLQQGYVSIIDVFNSEPARL